MSPTPRRVAVMLDLQWPYKRHAAIFAGTQQYAAGKGWQTIIDEFVHDTLPARAGQPVPYDGVIARANDQLAVRARRLRVPVVNVWASSPARDAVPGVYPDSEAAGQLCAEHLLARGFRTFASLTSVANIDHVLEVDGFVRTLVEAGCVCVSTQLPSNPWDSLSHWRKTERLIDQMIDGWHPPVGVYAGHEGYGRMIVQACHRRGWRVPMDVAIIAGKNEETLCEHPRPSLTSLEIGYDRIGYEAARLLDLMMDGEPAPDRPIRLPPQGLVVRESTDVVAVNDVLVAAALTYIAANSHRRIGPDDVARAVGAETRTLQNHFRRVLNRAIAGEIRRVRIDRAKHELGHSQRPLADIARDVGFGDIQRMYEVFRREMNVSPSDYRKQRQTER